MPQSPRHLMNTGREEECLHVLARLRNKPADDLLVRIEFLEVKALRMFEVETSAERYPQYQDGSFKSKFMIGFNDYKSLITNPSLFKRTSVAVSQSNGSFLKDTRLLTLSRVLDHDVPTMEWYQCHQLLCVSPP